MRHLSLTTCRASHVPAGPWLDCVLCAGRRSDPEILPARRPAALATAATVRGAGVPRAGPVLMPEYRQAASGRPGLRAGRAHDHTDNLAHRIHRYHVTLGAKHTAVSLHNRLSALLSLKLGLATGTAAAQRAVRHWLQARLDDNGDQRSTHTSQWLSEQVLHALISAALTERYNQWLDDVFDTDPGHSQFALPAMLATAAKSDQKQRAFETAKRHFALDRSGRASLAPLARELTLATQAISRNTATTLVGWRSRTGTLPESRPQRGRPHREASKGRPPSHMRSRKARPDLPVART